MNAKEKLERATEFISSLAQAQLYKSHPLGFEDSLGYGWKEEAQEVLAILEAPDAPPASSTAPAPELCAKCGLSREAEWHVDLGTGHGHLFVATPAPASVKSARKVAEGIVIDVTGYFSESFEQVVADVEKRVAAAVADAREQAIEECAKLVQAHYDPINDQGSYGGWKANGPSLAAKVRALAAGQREGEK